VGESNRVANSFGTFMGVLIPTKRKNPVPDLVRVLKDSFQNTVYLERGMPYFAFVSTNAVLVRKIDKP
jgi:hypothetical protein